MKRLLLIGSLPESLVRFRYELIVFLVSKGMSVHVAAPNLLSNEAIVKKFKSLNVECHDIYLSRSSVNPLREIKAFLSIYSKIRYIRPNYLLTYTIKPNIYTGFCSRFFSKIKFFPMITGLGYLFQKPNIFRRIVSSIISIIHKISFSKCEGIIFQNQDNMELFINKNITDEHKTIVVGGSGVSLNFYQKKPIPEGNIFLMASRLLKEKGVLEYVEAATNIKKIYPNAEFILAGAIDNVPDAISLELLQKYNYENSVNYIGHQSDIRKAIEACSVFVLPSYHEGMPRSVLEAMAIGRPIITTNVAGCKDTVDHGQNGFLIRKNDVKSLCDAMEKIINTKKEHKDLMGSKSFLKVKESFDVNLVNKKIYEFINT